MSDETTETQDTNLSEGLPIEDNPVKEKKVGLKWQTGLWRIDS